jgi:hypothetical protein
MNRLRLADNYLLAAGGGAMMATTGKKCPPGYTYIPATGNCWPNSLLNKPTTANLGFMTLLRDNEESFYINAPTSDGTIIKIREDAFDYLDPMAFEAVMDILEPYNAPQVSGLFSKWRDRKREKKENRNQLKIDKINARAEGRALVATKGGGIGGALKGIAGAIFGGKNDTAIQPAETDPRSMQFQFGNTPDPDTDKKWYQKPEVIIPVAAGAALVIGLVVMQMRKKGKR